MTFEADGYLESLYRKVQPKYAFSARNQAEWQIWRDGLRAGFRKRLGTMPERVSLKPELLENTDCGDYIRQRIALQCDIKLWMPVYLLIPKDDQGMPKPAVVAVPGHGFGNRETVGLDPEGNEAENPGYQMRFPVELVKRGFVVIVPELLGFGDRRMSWNADQPLHHSACNHISGYLMMLGRSMAGMRVWDAMRCFDFLETRKDVDMSRAGIMGISGGGLVAAFTAALDDRVKAAVVSGYMNTFHDSVLAMHHCVDNYIYDLLSLAELPDLGGLIAPKPLLLECGERDPIFPLFASKKAFEQLESVYEVVGERKRLDIDIFAAEHQISGAKAYDFLQKWLSR